MTGYPRALLMASIAIVATATAAPAFAQDKNFDVPAQPAPSAIAALGRQADIQITAARRFTRGKMANAVRGAMSVDQALGVLLRGTGLVARRTGPQTYTVIASPVQPTPPPGGQGGAEGAGVSSGEYAAGVEPPEHAEAILVTGSRIRGRAPVGVPVITIDRKAIDQAGFATTQQIVQSIPQNFSGGANEGNSGFITSAGNGNSARGVGVNLRGLGQMSTLLLINGDRPALGGFSGSFADLSVIPASIIERVEIVPDGSSAIYGSDAVAGVVNVITRNNFRGAETRFRIGTADGDSQELQFSQLFGARWANGNAVIAYEYYRRGRLEAADRDYATDDLRPFGGLDRRGNYANPGTIYAGGRSFAIPAGQSGAGLTAAKLIPDAVNRGDTWDGVDILPMQRRHSIYTTFRQDIGPNLHLYARGMATQRNFDQAVKSSTDARRTVPVTNPYYVDPLGTGQPIGVNYSFVRDLGNETQRGRVRAFSATAGIEGSFDKWTVDLHGSWGRQNERYALLNRINTARLALALADTNPATAYNLLGDGPATNPATIDSIRGYNKIGWEGVVWATALRADGPLVALPAGSARLALGAEYRKDSYRSRFDISYTSTLTPRINAPTPLPGARIVKAAYAELLVPVFGGEAAIPGFHRLDLSAAVRTEQYSDFGRTTNPKLSFAWEPFAGLSLRGSYGKSFRAPIFTELRQDPASKGYFAWAAADPQSPTGTSNILVIRGNDPDLRPERATSWTLGADLKPSFARGFRAGITWFSVDYRDRIATPAPNLANFLINRDIYAPILTPNPSAARVAEIFDSPYYLDLTGIPRTANFIAEADARLQNLSVVKQSGLDIDIAQRFDLGAGHAELGVVSTYIFHIKQALTPTAKRIDVVDTVGNPADLRLRARATFTSGGLDAAVFANYVDGYTNKTTLAPERVASWTTVDLNLGYTFGNDSPILKGMRVALNASNIFDSDPPYVSYFAGTFTSGYDPENASPLGRFVALQLTKSW